MLGAGSFREPGGRGCHSPAFHASGLTSLDFLLRAPRARFRETLCGGIRKVRYRVTEWGGGGDSPLAFSVAEKRDKYCRMCGMPRRFRDPRSPPWGWCAPGFAPLAKGRYVFSFNDIRIVLLPISRRSRTPPRTRRRWIALPDGGQHCVAFPCKVCFINSLRDFRLSSLSKNNHSHTLASNLRFYATLATH